MEKTTKQSTEIRQAGLIEAALALAAQRSPAGITTSDLAHAVGITQGALFRHFESKQTLWLAVLGWVHDTLMQRLQNAADSQPDDALAALRGVFMAHIEFVLAYPGVPRIVFHELQQPEDSPQKAQVRALMLAYRRLLMHLLTQAKSEKTIAIDADLESASVLFIGSIQGLVMQALMAGEPAAMAQNGQAVFALLQRALQSPQAPISQGTP